ncbi:transcriptional regulator [Methanobrevibacter sp.]|uniref:transcriptional regulator n=1 Tax=Methanobrevibacter sp. TaxID=66852 RepID=UPI0038693BC6
MTNETLEYVKRSKYRQKVLTALEDDVLMPKQIAERSGIKTNHVSKVLAELKCKDLIELINPEYRKGRLYRIKKDGKVIIGQINNES